MNNHILIMGNPIQKEANAAEAITPGELIDLNSDGKMVPHGTEGGNARPRFAREEDYGGQSIDTDYKEDERVPYYVNRPGDEVQAFLAAGENVALGDPLESDGAGGLQKHTPQAIDEGGTETRTVNADAIVAYAAEIKDNSTGEDRVRIVVEVA